VKMQSSGTRRRTSTVPGSETRTAPNAPRNVSRRPTSTEWPTRLLQPYEPQAPGRAVDRIGRHEPDGRSGPPPALPFGPALQSGMGPARKFDVKKCSGGSVAAGCECEFVER